MTIDDVLEQVRARLDLEADREYELLEEIRGHLEEAVADARARGIAEEPALEEAVRRFGVEPAADALRQTYMGRGALDGVLAAALPVIGVLMLRWLIFAPNGSFGGWQQVVSGPALSIIAFAGLVIPLLRFRRHRLALASWALLWGISLVMMLGAAVRW